jgi:hypothetical protein
MGPAGHEGGAEGGQRGVFGRDGAGRPAGVAGPAAGRREAAAASAVLQGRVIGGPNPPCPYETSAAGPIRAPGDAGDVGERLRQERRHPAAVCAAVRGALRGPGARREGFPAAGGRKRRGGVCGPPQAAHGGGASAAGGAAEARSAAMQGRPPHPPLPPSDDSAEGGPEETS